MPEFATDMSVKYMLSPKQAESVTKLAMGFEFTSTFTKVSSVQPNRSVMVSRTEYVPDLVY